MISWVELEQIGIKCGATLKESFSMTGLAEPILNSPAPDVRTREKLEGGQELVMQSEFEPAGDQPTAIAELVEYLRVAAQLVYEELAELRHGEATTAPGTDTIH